LKGKWRDENKKKGEGDHMRNGGAPPNTDEGAEPTGTLAYAVEDFK
jgi:hypothetical protein